VLPFDHTYTLKRLEVSDVEHAVRNERGREAYPSEIVRMSKADAKKALDEAQVDRAASGHDGQQTQVLDTLSIEDHHQTEIAARAHN
jgi:hypothetical protein